MFKLRSSSDASCCSALSSEGAYPTVASYTGNWAIDPSSHSLLWTVPRVSSSDGTRSGSLEFSVGGEDATSFFPVKVNFTGLGSLIGISVRDSLSCCVMVHS